MTSGDSRFARFIAASVVFGALCFGGSAAASEDPNNGFGPNDRPTFLFVSISQGFDVPPVGEEPTPELRTSAGLLGSKVVRVNLGTYAAGGAIATTRFDGLGPISIDLSDVPPDPGTELPPNFDQHQFTVLGSFRTLDPDDVIHMMTPYPGVIAPQVQTAFFNASAFFDDPEALPKYPTTVQMALFVYDHQLGAGAGLQDVLDAMFVANPGPPIVLAGSSPSEGDGPIFPHHPGDDALFDFHAVFDSTAGIVDAEVCLPIAVDVKPGNAQNSVNAGLDGVLPVAVLSTPTFDAVHEFDPSKFVAVTLDAHGVVLKSVAPIRWTLVDVDGDGDLDVLFKFSVPDLTAGSNAPLVKGVTTIEFRGRTNAGMCVDGADSVRYVPPKK
jgi:hypothetical protein